ncbi:hypothetical protein [Streptomyces sp. NPDC005017]|uniref:hypothetical protein n=1 Tax=Streptomyces sp. NPDC005017 TaxID=3364706 RepID=UPI003687D1FB
MTTHIANGDPRLSLWLRVREYAVPTSMIETATVRRRAGDWAGACAAAGVDVDLSLRSTADLHGREFAARVRADLRCMAPDLLRWHMPRVAPDGLLRPGLTVSLARYEGAGRDGASPVHLVVRTPPARADAGQRMSLALWDGARPASGTGGHPHARPNRRFRLDLHRHLWDVRRSAELRARSGSDEAPSALPVLSALSSMADPHAPGMARCAVGRWAAEAEILLDAEQRPGEAVAVRLGARQRLLVRPTGPADASITPAPADGRVSTLPVLPEAATWVPPDLELLRAGLIEPGLLHPLVAEALAPGHAPGPPPAADPVGGARLVECRGARHRIGLVDGVLAPLDHDPAEVRREELLAALSGPPLPCLRAIDEAHRRPECLTGVRERLAHGDIAGALAVVEGLLGPEAVLRSGPLLDELEAAAGRRVAYGLFRAGLAEPSPHRSAWPGPKRPGGHRSHPRHTTAR